MTFSMWLMILTLAVGPGTSQSIESNSPISTTSTGTWKIGNNCWINGVWYNPCPTEPPPPSPEPSPEIQLP